MAPETPKGVSSRLLTMKFMQRAAASETPQASPESTTSSSKKRKLEHSPAQGRLSVNFDQASVEAALAEQEAQRQAALTRHTTGDTHWVLNSSLDKKKPEAKSRGSNKIVYVGYGEIDSGNESAEEDAPQQGRTSTSGYKKARNKGPKKDQDGTASDSSNGDDDSGDQGAPQDDREVAKKSDNSSRNASRSRSQSRHRSENAKAKEFREKRKKKEVQLSKLKSISSGGNKDFSTSAMKCYTCQGSGHKAADCPKR